ncbi:MAG: PilZ domain-containing protein [Granulosicoccus sp.]
MDTPLNRRKSFRVNDALKLELRRLDAETLDEIVANFDIHRNKYCMKSHAKSQMDLNQPRLLQIRKRQPEIAQYLEYLELKVIELSEELEKIGRAKRSGESVGIESEGDISAVGIRFRTTVDLAAGQHVELGIVLSTSEIHVMLVGEVVRVDPDDNINGSWISVRYKNIHNEDKEAIVRHLVKLQQLQLQTSRSLQ